VIPGVRLPLVPVAAVLGALIGSFLNVVIARLPHGENIAYPGSRCSSCHAPIPWYLNLPIVSWLVLRGRCATCKATISPRYPVIEGLTAVLFVACVARFGASWATPVAWAFTAALIVITFVDIDIWEIPDEVSFPGIVIGCIARPLVFDVPWWSGIVGASLGGLALWFVRWFYLRFRDVEGMGLGDVKLIAMIGAFVGVGGLLPVILVASIAGTLIGGLLLLLAPRVPADGSATAAPASDEGATASDPREAQSDDEDDWEPPPNAVPFGPFLALGALTELLLGPQIDLVLFRLGT